MIKFTVKTRNTNAVESGELGTSSRLALPHSKISEKSFSF